MKTFLIRNKVCSIKVVLKQGFFAHKSLIFLNIKKRLRFYKQVEFVVSSTKSKFLILLIKPIFLLNKKASGHQVFLITFWGKV